MQTLPYKEKVFQSSAQEPSLVEKKFSHRGICFPVLGPLLQASSELKGSAAKAKKLFVRERERLRDPSFPELTEVA